MRNEIDERLSAGDQVGALALARQYWKSSPDPSVARFIKSRFEALWAGRTTRRHRVGVLRSFTVEPALGLLEAEAALRGCRLETWVGSFNAYAQEILDPRSALHSQELDTIILALQARDIAPDLWRRFGELSQETIQVLIDETVDHLTDILGKLRATTSANIICHGLESPLFPADGFLELHRGVRQRDVFEAVNRRVREWCADQRGVYLLDYDGLIARHGRERWVDEKKWATAKLPLTINALGWLAADWWRHLEPLVLPQAKVLVLDLDNTVWGGVLGEDGPSGIRMDDEHPGTFYRAFQRAVLDIARRGVLIALASKNNESDALEIIDSHADILIRRTHLAAWRINWQPKPNNLIELAQELNVGLDSFVFVDDNPAECEAVRRALPEVEVVDLPKDPSTYASILRGIPRLERFSLSDEDAERTRYYVEERERREVRASADSLEDFLASLQISIAIEPVSPATLARASQLTQKTNQLNMTTRRYGEAELQAKLSQPGWAGYTLRASDRFGDNGIVGFALTHTEGAECEIDTFLMSCRVIGRRIETAFVAHISEIARAQGATRLTGWFLPTAKNVPAAQIYEDAGLEIVNTDGAAQLWGLDLSAASVTTPPWIESAVPEPSAA